MRVDYHHYGLSLGGGVNVLAGKVFRIGHLGWLNELTLLQALAGTEMAMRHLGWRGEAGSGVAIAEEYWSI